MGWGWGWAGETEFLDFNVPQIRTGQREREGGGGGGWEGMGEMGRERENSLRPKCAAAQIKWMA